VLLRHDPAHSLPKAWAVLGRGGGLRGVDGREGDQPLRNTLIAILRLDDWDNLAEPPAIAPETSTASSETLLQS
jgi:hypothetical protein